MKIGWAFFGLAAVAVIAYALNRGVYLGYTVYLDPKGNQFAPSRPWYRMECRYLYPSGISYETAGSGFTREEAADGVCRFFNSN